MCDDRSPAAGAGARRADGHDAALVQTDGVTELVVGRDAGLGADLRVVAPADVVVVFVFVEEG